jgi:hypothetical protein
VNENDTETNVKTGKIELKVHYDRNTSNLNVTVLRCKNLACDSAKNCDPYVKLLLEPTIDSNTNSINTTKNNNENKRKTSVRKNTCDPIYEETLRVNDFINLFIL